MKAEIENEQSKLPSWEDITYSCWFPVLSIWAYLLLITSIVIVNPFYLVYYNLGPLKLLLFSIIQMPTLFVLVYQFYRVEKVKK